jgi:hypothetical protein
VLDAFKYACCDHITPPLGRAKTYAAPDLPALLLSLPFTPVAELSSYRAPITIVSPETATE